MTNYAYPQTSTMALDYFYSNLKSFLPVVCCEAWGKLRSIGRWPVWLGRGTEHSLISRCRRSWRSPSCRVSVKKYWWFYFAFSFSTRFPPARPSCLHTHSLSWLGLGNQVGSTSDHLTTYYLPSTQKDQSTMRAELTGIIANIGWGKCNMRASSKGRYWWVDNITHYWIKHQGFFLLTAISWLGLYWTRYKAVRLKTR